MINKKEVVIFGHTVSPDTLKFFYYLSKQKYFKISLIIFSKSSSQSIIKKTLNFFPYRVAYFKDSMPHKNKRIIKAVKTQKIKLGICLAFPNKVRKSFLRLFKNGIINFHPSALPLNKGCHHSFWGIYKNTDHGCTMHMMDDSFDGGPIIDQIKYKNNIELNAQYVFNKSIDLKLILFKKNIIKIYRNNFKFKKIKKKGTYYSKSAIKKVVELDVKRKIEVKDLWNIIRGTNCKDIYKNTDHGFYIKFKDKKFKITSKIQKITTR